MSTIVPLVLIVIALGPQLPANQKLGTALSVPVQVPTEETDPNYILDPAFIRDAYRLGPGVANPTVLRAVKLPFPEGLINERTVTVKLKIRIGAHGTVEDVRVTESFQRGGVDVEAMNVAREWLFTPATMDGKPIPVIADLILTTTMDAKAAQAAGAK